MANNFIADYASAKEPVGLHLHLIVTFTNLSAINTSVKYDLIGKIGAETGLSPEEQKNTVCFKGQEYCDYLFHIEKKYKDAEPEERHRKRLALLKPVMDAFLCGLKRPRL